MLKATIILWIFSCVIRFVIKVIDRSLSTDERLEIEIMDRFPKRVIIATALWLVVTLAAVVTTILSVIKYVTM